MLYDWRHTFCPFFFALIILKMGSCKLLPGLLQTSILLISASQQAGITGMNHWHPAKNLVISKENSY
jgi:hypothetical protein